MAATLTDQFQQASSRAFVVFVRLQVFGQGIDARCQERNLHFRGTGVLFESPVLFNDLGLFFRRNAHVVLPNSFPLVPENLKKRRLNSTFLWWVANSD